MIRREPAERTRLSDTRNTVDHIIFQGERSPSLTHKRTKRQPAIAAGLNAPRRNRVGRQHGWPADVPSAEQRRAQRQRDLEAIRRAYAEMVATSHEIDDDTAELALLSMHLDDEQRRRGGDEARLASVSLPRRTRQQTVKTRNPQVGGGLPSPATARPDTATVGERVRAQVLWGVFGIMAFATRNPERGGWC